MGPSGFAALIIFLAIVVAPQLFSDTPFFPRITTLLILTCISIVFWLVRSESVAVFCNSILFLLLFFPLLIQLTALHSFASIGLTAMTNLAFLSSLVFLVVFNLSYLLMDYKIRFGPTAQRRRAKRPSVRGAVLVLIALLSFFLLLGLFGPSEIFTDRARYRMGDAERLSSSARFVQNVLKVVPFWAAYFYITRRQQLGKTTVTPALLVSVAIGLLVSNPVNTQRYISLLGPALVFFAYLEGGHMKSLWRNSHFLVAMTMLLLPLTSILRVGKIDFSIERVTESFFTLEFSAMAIFNDLFATHFVSASPPNRVLSAVFVLFPRSIWKTKNEGTGTEVANYAGYVYSNVGIPPFADAYLDWGILGVVLLAAVAGWAARRANTRIENASIKNADIGFGAALSYVALFPIFLRGDLSTFFIAFYSSVVAFAFLKAFFGTLSVREKRKQ